jgi:soluble cytochrome b562
MIDADNSLHRLVGRLEGAVEHLNNNFKMKDAEAAENRKELHRKVDAMQGQILAVQMIVTPMQQDVAEMKNKMDDFEKADVANQLQEQRSLGSWDTIKAIGSWFATNGRLLWAGIVLLAGYLLHLMTGR